MDRILLTDEMLESTLLARIQEELNSEADAIVGRAVEEFRLKVRDRIGQIVLRTISQYSIERNGRELVIRVDNRNGRILFAVQPKTI